MKRRIGQTFVLQIPKVQIPKGIPVQSGHWKALLQIFGPSCAKVNVTVETMNQAEANWLLQQIQSILPIGGCTAAYAPTFLLPIPGAPTLSKKLIWLKALKSRAQLPSLDSDWEDFAFIEAQYADTIDYFVNMLSAAGDKNGYLVKATVYPTSPKRLATTNVLASILRWPPSPSTRKIGYSHPVFRKA